MEDLIAEIINTYGQQLWTAVVVLVVTGFVLTMIKNFINDLVNYFKARMSDIGFGQRIYFGGQIYLVEKITFRHIRARDDKKIIYVPIGSYLSGVREYPINRHDDFDESKYHEKPWDGKTERRQSQKEEDK